MKKIGFSAKSVARMVENTEDRSQKTEARGQNLGVRRPLLDRLRPSHGVSAPKACKHFATRGFGEKIAFLKKRVDDGFWGDMICIEDIRICRVSYLAGKFTIVCRRVRFTQQFCW